MNLHAKLGLAARGHDNPILGSLMSTKITQLMSILCPHLSWRMPCGMTWGRPAPAATTSIWYGVSLLGPETAAWRGLWSLALEAFPQHIAVRQQCSQEARGRLVSFSRRRHACRSSEGPKRAGGRGDERAGSLGPGASPGGRRLRVHGGERRGDGDDHP